MLLFKKRFLEAIRRGEKTQTIRLWKRRFMRPGQRSYIPGVGQIRIISVEPVRLEELTDADAIPDGFATVQELRAEIAKLYGDPLPAGYQAYRVTFQIESRSNLAQEQCNTEGPDKNSLLQNPSP
ncbi:MAG: ASCH domain-containing protein [Thermoguttaceae bacterium]|nr:ASCH domain-containing protein [Thermoguttaceae bacterium]MDW8036863.1 ASCH domain-containing protein [Thermoguttaceae bacterium]